MDAGDQVDSVDPVDPDAPVTDVPEESPIPTEPLPEPEVVDGNAWLISGYAMQMDEGWWNGVVSLVEGVIELPEPMVLEPAAVEPEVLDGRSSTS